MINNNKQPKLPVPLYLTIYALLLVVISTINITDCNNQSRHKKRALRMIDLLIPSNFVLYFLVGKGGLEPPRLAAHDPKSCLSANSSTSPKFLYYKCKAEASQ